jgi:hypothetical protein
MRRELIIALIVGMAVASAVAADRAAERRRMVESIESTALAIGSGTGHAKLDARVLEALRTVPRHEFVPAEVAHLAYADRPLDIGFRQSISHPFIVALMTHLLQVQPGDRVLEIGTGSGYQAAVLSALAREVYSVEIVAELGNRARLALSRLGYANSRLALATAITDGKSTPLTTESSSPRRRTTFLRPWSLSSSRADGSSFRSAPSTPACRCRTSWSSRKAQTAPPPAPASPRCGSCRSRAARSPIEGGSFLAGAEVPGRFNRSACDVPRLITTLAG